MELQDIKIGGWYWFYSDWHNSAVMGQAKRIINAGKPEPRVEFWKVTKTYGLSAEWRACACTHPMISEVIKEVKACETA